MTYGAPRAAQSKELKKFALCIEEGLEGLGPAAVFRNELAVN